MKPVISIVLSSIGLLTAQVVCAQGTLYLSALEETPVAYDPVASNAWIARGFFTGGASGGYIVNSVQLLMGEASGTPSDFNVMLYNSFSRTPLGSFGSLSGPDPAPGGVFTYTTPGITLSHGQLYFIVVTAASAVAQDAYHWSFANTYNYTGSGGWRAASFGYISNDGLNWTPGAGSWQFAVYATAIPEPSSWALAGLGLIGLGLRRRKARASGTAPFDSERERERECLRNRLLDPGCPRHSVNNPLNLNRCQPWCRGLKLPLGKSPAAIASRMLR